MRNMITSLTIKGFRAFDTFAISDLGRVNLFVGKNNCGKTSALEAAALLASGGDALTLSNLLDCRGEFTESEEKERRLSRNDYEISHLFHGHSLVVDSAFEITGLNAGPSQCKGIIRDAANFADGGALRKVAKILEERVFDVFFCLEASAQSNSEANEKTRLAVNEGIRFGVSPSGLVSGDDLLKVGFRKKDFKRYFDLTRSGVHVNFVPAGGLNADQMSVFWDRLVLTPQETTVVESLRIVEAGIERIAAVSRGPLGNRFRVKLKDFSEPLPLGSLGDGAKRLLGLSMAVTHAAGGAVMIDEIDSGLHYSAMIKMWKMVIETAHKLDIQVFATTHSLDCVRGLADLYKEAPEICEEVRLHRIQRDMDKAMTYSAREVHIAMEHEMEVR